MVYSALLRFLLPQSRWPPLSVLCVPSAIRQVGLGGKGEIRTPGPFRIVGFQDRWFKPLTHLTLLPSGEGYCCFVCLCAPRLTALVAVSRGNPPRKAFLSYLGVHGLVRQIFLIAESFRSYTIPCGLAFTSGLLLSEDFLTIYLRSWLAKFSEYSP